MSGNNITSNLTISLIDQVSGPAKQAAASLKSIDKSAAALASGGKGADTIAASMDKIAKSAKGLNVGWSRGFTDEINKLGLSGKKLDEVRASWDKLVRSLGTGKGAMAGLPKLDAWEKSTLASLKRVETASRRQREGGGAGNGAGLAGSLIGAYGAQRVARQAVRAGAIAQREDARDYLAGLTPADTARLITGSKEISTRYKSLDIATAHERLRDTAMSIGSVDKALGLSDAIGAGHTVLQSLKGPQEALEESRKFFKALDTLGRNVDSDQVRGLYNGFVKALGVEGADMNMGDLFKVAKMAKSGGASLSDKFLMSTAPALMQDMGPDRLGTAIGSMVSQIIGGRATKASKGIQQQYGLRDKKGNFLDEKMVMSDPLEYTMKRLIPALEKRGVDINDSAAVTAATSKLFSNQMVADLFTKLITQRQQYEKKAEQYDKAPGLDAAKKLPTADPFVAVDGLMAQLRNWGASLSQTVLGENSMGAINKLSTAIGGLAASAESAPSAIAQTAAAIGGFVGSLMLAGNSFKRLMQGKNATAATVAGPVGVGATIVAGGAAASVISNEILKNNMPAFQAYGENPMLGADPSGIGLAYGIHDSVEAARRLAEQQQKAKEEAAKRVEEMQPNWADRGPKLGGPAETGDIGSAVQGMLDKLKAGEGEAGAAGSATGDAFGGGLRSSLSAAEAEVQASVQRMQSMLNFKASPTITPNISAPSGGGGVGKQSARATSTKLGSLTDSTMRGSFMDSEFA